jgi:sec-independent protein translocase protein TatA
VPVTGARIFAPVEREMPSWTQILLVVVLIVLLFGRGKISDMMGDFAKGIKSFKKGLSDDDEADVARPEPKTIDATVNREESAEAKNKATNG